MMKKIIGPGLPYDPTLIIKVGKAIWNFIKGLGKSKKIDEKSTAEDINQISMALLDIRAHTLKESESMIADVKDSMKSYAEELFFVIDDKLDLVDKYTYRVFKEDIDKLMHETEEYWHNAINKKISLDNIDCLNILKMVAGNRKESAMNDFVLNLLKDTAKNYTAYINKKLVAIYDEFEKNIEDNMRGMEEKVHSFEELSMSLDNKDFLAFEEKIAKANTKLFVYDEIANDLK